MHDTCVASALFDLMANLPLAYAHTYALLYFVRCTNAIQYQSKIISLNFFLLLFIFFYILRVQYNLTMDADVLSALKTQAAYLAGNRDRPIIIVKAPAGELKSTWKKQPLDLCLQYLINSLR